MIAGVVRSAGRSLVTGRVGTFMVITGNEMFVNVRVKCRKCDVHNCESECRKCDICKCESEMQEM